MVYAATSEYQYITGDELEAFSNITYTTLTDPIPEANVVAVITQSERTINVKCNTTFTAPIPDAVKMIVLDLSERTMYNRMVWMGLMDRENPKKMLKPLWDESWDAILEPFIITNATTRSMHITTRSG